MCWHCGVPHARHNIVCVGTAECLTPDTILSVLALRSASRPTQYCLCWHCGVPHARHNIVCVATALH
ncbi:hypothetical protein J6590_052559 [Homalodisca vitripennis]|nr:hypothetical protein J6590_052559 [Homalodisca vitripennis]